MEHWLLRAAAMHPLRVALAGSSGAVTYAELVARALAMAGGLHERGVEPGDRVALAIGPGEELVAALHGCLLAGAIAVPIDLRLGPAERAARSQGAVLSLQEPLGAPALTAGHGDAASQEPPRPTAAAVTPLALDRVAVVMHTSGTTSRPRAIELRYGNWLAGALGSAVALGLDGDERWLCPLPLAHVGGLSIAIRSAVYGTTAVLHERFDAERVVGALMDRAARITLVSLVPTMLARLLDAGLNDPPTLRWALLGGGPIAPALLRRAREAGVPVAPSYGMTEGCSQIATNGWALPGVEVRVAPDGEVLVRGATIASGSLASDGWLHTGDLGALDERGRLAISGRRADTIVTGGENVAPVEVEEALLEHPAVAEAAVFGRPDPEWGELVTAIVVPADPAAPPGLDVLRGFARGRLPGYAAPRAVVVVPAVPLLSSGKPDLRALRVLAQQG